MSEPCIAEKEWAEGVLRRCKKRRWGGTKYCYQHAISYRAAIVVTPAILEWAIDGGRRDPESAKVALRLWGKLERLNV